jgi:demethoxyubiquinone hydroxylase (CLK1/Coq7/Cat5 family)
VARCYGPIRLLQLAPAGERAAAFAYAGHWRSVRRPADRERIRTIKAEECGHRRGVHQMLSTRRRAGGRLRGRGWS